MSVVVVAVSVVMVVVLGSVVVVVVVLVIVVVVVAVVVAVCAVGRFRHAAVLGGVGVTVVAAVVALAWLSVVLVSLVAWVVGLASSFAMNMDMLEGSPACLVNAFHVSFLFFFASALMSAYVRWSGRSINRLPAAPLSNWARVVSLTRRLSSSLSRCPSHFSLLRLIALTKS